MKKEYRTAQMCVIPTDEADLLRTSDGNVMEDWDSIL